MIKYDQIFVVPRLYSYINYMMINKAVVNNSIYTEGFDEDIKESEKIVRKT
jgi:hypothetical protein